MKKVLVAILVVGLILLFLYRLNPQDVLAFAYQKCVENELWFCQDIEDARNYFFGEPQTISQETLLSAAYDTAELALVRYEIHSAVTNIESSSLPGIAGDVFERLFGQGLTASATVVVRAGIDESKISGVRIDEKQMIIYYFVPHAQIFQPSGILTDTLVFEYNPAPGQQARHTWSDLTRGLLKEPSDLHGPALSELIAKSEQEAFLVGPIKSDGSGREEPILTKAERRYRVVLQEEVDRLVNALSGQSRMTAWLAKITGKDDSIPRYRVELVFID